MILTLCFSCLRHLPLLRQWVSMCILIYDSQGFHSLSRFLVHFLMLFSPAYTYKQHEEAKPQAVSEQEDLDTMSDVGNGTSSATTGHKSTTNPPHSQHNSSVSEATADSAIEGATSIGAVSNSKNPKQMHWTLMRTSITEMMLHTHTLSLSLFHQRVCLRLWCN